MFDAKIVSACIADRRAYDRVKAHIDPQEFTPTGRFWWGLVAAWYQADPGATAVDSNILRERAVRTAGRNAELSLDWFDAAQAAPCPSPENVAGEVLDLKREVAWRRLAAAMEGERDPVQIAKLVDEHQELVKATTLTQRSELTWGSRLEDLSEAVGSGNRIRLWPEKLQEKTGGAMPGDHIVVFGRPESGKTLFSVNMVAGWLRDGHNVLYVGNEDNIDKIQDRVRHNLSGMTKAQVEKWTDEANKRCRDKGWDRLRAVHLFPGSAAEIADIVEETRPTCLVVDQLRNLHSPGSKGGTKAQRLDDIACDVRQLGAKYGLVVMSVGQANAGDQHGRPREWLDLDDFDESRTGVPGQADLMVGIGVTPELDAHNQRALSLPKNKMSGDHAGFVVNIDKLRSRIQ